jgi:hypothetical protein
VKQKPAFGNEMCCQILKENAASVLSVDVSVGGMKIVPEER